MTRGQLCKWEKLLLSVCCPHMGSAWGLALGAPSGFRGWGAGQGTAQWQFCTLMVIVMSSFNPTGSQPSEKAQGMLVTHGSLESQMARG